MAGCSTSNRYTVPGIKQIVDSCSVGHLQAKVKATVDATSKDLGLNSDKVGVLGEVLVQGGPCAVQNGFGSFLFGCPNAPGQRAWPFGMNALNIIV